MQTLSDPFALERALFTGMDGRPDWLEQKIQSHINHDTAIVAGDAVDIAIAVSMQQAARQHENAAEVLNHLEYIHTQLGIFIGNLKRFPEGVRVDPERLAREAKHIRQIQSA